MSESATRTSPSPGSRSSSRSSTNSARIFRSGVSVSRYALNLSTRPPAFALQVFRCLHLLQPSHAALKLSAVVAFHEDLFGLRLCGNDQLDPLIVEHIDQPGEAPRGVGILGGQARQPGEDHGEEALRQVDVIGVGARSAAQRLEIEPHQAAGALAVGDLASFDVERLALLLDVLQFIEDPLEPVLAAGPDVIHLHPLQLAPPVVDAAVDADHVEALLEQLDRRQEALALQAARVERVGMVIRGHDELDAAVHGPLQEAPEDHRVGDVGDMKFIKADQPVAPRSPGRDGIDRVLGALQLVELAVQLAHEVMKMDAALPHERHAQVERVHQEALAAPDRSPQVDALRQRRPDEQPFQRVVAPRLVGAPLLVEALQPLHRAPLRGIRYKSALRQVLLVEGNDILRHGSVAIRSCAVRSSSVRIITGSSVIESSEMRSSCMPSQAIVPLLVSQIWKNRRTSPICVSMTRKPSMPKRFFELCVKPWSLSCAI